MFKYVSICNNYIPTILLINVWWLSSLPCGISSRVQTPARTFEFSCGILCKFATSFMMKENISRQSAQTWQEIQCNVPNSKTFLVNWLYCLMFTVTYCKGQQWGIQLVLLLVVMVVSRGGDKLRKNYDIINLESFIVGATVQFFPILHFRCGGLVIWPILATQVENSMF